MDPRERVSDIRVMLSAALDGRQAEIWTTLPGFIVSYDPTLITCSVQPAISIQTIDPTNSNNPILVNMPVLVDCPVLFPHGGGFTLTFPIKPGDECVVFIASRCIDNWWKMGPTTGVNQLQPRQGDLRMHDLSDGFVLVGPRSVPNVIGGVSPNTVQLRSDDGAAYIELAAGHVVNIVAPGGVNITGDVHVTGKVNATGEGTFNGGHTVSAHVHSGVTRGSADTDPPTG